MPWQETSPREERKQVVGDHRLGVYDMNELCARYGVSRKTGPSSSPTMTAIPRRFSSIGFWHQTPTQSTMSCRVLPARTQR